MKRNPKSVPSKARKAHLMLQLVGHGWSTGDHMAPFNKLHCAAPSHTASMLSRIQSVRTEKPSSTRKRQTRAKLAATQRACFVHLPAQQLVCQIRQGQGGIRQRQLYRNWHPEQIPGKYHLVKGASSERHLRPMPVRRPLIFPSNAAQHHANTKY